MENVQVYTVKDICEILSISKPTAYKLITNAPFRVVKVCDKYRIPKESFDKWLCNNACLTKTEGSGIISAT